MFPLASQTVFHLLLVGSCLLSAVALRQGWKWRLLFLLFALSLPAGLLLSDPPTGQYAGLGYLIVVGSFSIAVLIGMAMAGTTRLMRLSPMVSILALLGIGGAASFFELWRQYVPPACLDEPIQVQIAGTTLRLPSQLRPRLEREDEIYHFGREDRKLSFAKLCRQSRNGQRPLNMDTVWLSPAANHEKMTTTCTGTAPPPWCSGYSDYPYRHIGKILIASDNQHAFRPPYWNPKSRIADRKGDLVQGSVCLRPPSVTQCWAWRPFGKGSRLTVETNNQDDIFKDMPLEDARQLIANARDMTLGIISQKDK